MSKTTKEHWFDGNPCMCKEVDGELCEHHYWIVNRDMKDNGGETHGKTS